MSLPAPQVLPTVFTSCGVFIGADAGCCVTDGRTGSGKVGRTGTVITGFGDTEAVVAGCCVKGVGKACC